MIQLRYLIVALIILGLPTLAAAEMNDINGTWSVIATMQSTVDENGPQPGFQKTEVWQIVQTEAQAQLTTPTGTVQGRFVPQTPEFPMGVWMFQVEIPNFGNQPNLAAGIEVVIAGGPTSDRIQGGTSITYYAGNPFTGQWTPAGMETWVFEGFKQ